MGQVVLDDDDAVISNPEMIFTDRSDPQKLFWDAYDALNNNEFYVINYHGFGGIGKSWLCRHLCSAVLSGTHPLSGRPITSKSLILNLEDLKNNCDQVTVTENLANKLEGECGFSFPLFKYGLYVYYRTKGYSVNSPEIKRIQDNAIGAAVFDAVELIPIVGGIGALLLKGVDSLSAALRNKVVKNSEYIKKLDLLSSEDMAGEIVRIFAKELREQTAAEKDPVVIFLDTYEQMQYYVYQTASAKVSEEWLWSRTGIIRRVPNVLWVFSGQRKLTWEKDDSFWRSEENASYEEILEIKDDDLLRNMLTDIGIDDPSVVNVIVEKTGGVPVHLALCKDIYFNMKRDGMTPRVEDFDMGYTQLATRFIGGLNSELKDIVHTLACLGSWTEADIEHLQLSPDSYGYILQMSFISRADATFYMHHSVQEIVIKDCPVIIVNRVRSYFEQKLNDPERTDDEVKDLVWRILKLELQDMGSVSDAKKRALMIGNMEESLTPYIYRYGVDSGFFTRVRDAIEAAVAEEELSPLFSKTLNVYTVYHYAENGESSRIRAYVDSRQLMVGHLKLPNRLRSYLYFAMSIYENSLKNYSDARQYLLEALEFWNADENLREYLDALGRLGRICISLRSYDEAEHYSDIGIGALKEKDLSYTDTGIAVSHCELWVNKAKVERYKGNTRNAFEHLVKAEEVLRPYQDLGNERILFEHTVVYQQYTFLYRKVGRPDLRRKYAEKSLRLTKDYYEMEPSERNRRSLAIAYLDMGKACSSYEECKTYFDMAIGTYEQIQDAQPSSRNYSDLFYAIRNAVDNVSLQDGPAYLARCHAMLEDETEFKVSWKDQYRFYQTEINYYYYAKQWETALEKLRALENMLEWHKDRLSEEDRLDHVSWNYREYAIIYEGMGDMYESLNFLQKENAIEYRLYTKFVSYSDGRSYSDSCRMLAKAYSRKRMYGRALVYAKKQIEIEKHTADEFRGIFPVRKLIAAYKVMAEVYESQQDAGNAMASYEQGYVYAKDLFESTLELYDLTEILLILLHMQKHYFRNREYGILAERYTDLLGGYQKLLDRCSEEDAVIIKKDMDCIRCILGKIIYLSRGDLEEARNDMLDAVCAYSNFTQRDKEFYLGKIEGELISDASQVIRPDAEMKKLIMDGTW